MAQTRRSDPPFPSQTLPQHGQAMSRASVSTTLLRFPGEGLPRLTLTAADRLVVSSAITGGRMVPRRRGILSPLGLVVLFLLAAMGAVSLYHSLASVFIS